MVAILSQSDKKREDWSCKMKSLYNVSDVVGSPLCVSAEAGQKVYEKISQLVLRGLNVILSFDQIETITPTFLNAAVGQLHGKFTETQIRELLSVRGMDQQDLALLKMVVDNAKLYFKHQNLLRAC